MLPTSCANCGDDAKNWQGGVFCQCGKFLCPRPEVFIWPALLGAAASVLAFAGGWATPIYILLHAVIFAVAIYVAFLSYKLGRFFFCGAMSIVALTYNPFGDISFAPETWEILNLIAAFLFAVSLLPVLRQNSTKQIQRERDLAIGRLKSEVESLEETVAPYHGLDYESVARALQLEKDKRLPNPMFEETVRVFAAHGVAVPVSETSADEIIEAREKLAIRKTLLVRVTSPGTTKRPI